MYLVSREGNAVFQMIQPGETQGDMVEAVTGLKAGDQVIVSRHDRQAVDGTEKSMCLQREVKHGIINDALRPKPS